MTKKKKFLGELPKSAIIGTISKPVVTVVRLYGKEGSASKNHCRKSNTTNKL